MKIGILGSGDVGLALARGFRAEGHEVKIGTRSPRESFVSFQEAAVFGETLVIATVWKGVKPAIDAAGADNFDGKVVLDVTNPLLMRENAAPELEIGHMDSGGEQVQRWLPKAKVVKVFNSVGNALMYRPEFPDGPPSMFIAGNDEDAKKAVTQVLTSFGWDTVDTGGIEGARMLEPMCLLWVVSAARSGNWSQAFKLLRKS
ncbi:MAG: NAD(P)-binding domain-containing protein [Candidatus Eremiobacteraeota bacterium]|nr:NAD(P)-binding domain-containing protein [Candidatus Eremiobacteraeota bacterium]